MRTTTARRRSPVLTAARLLGVLAGLVLTGGCGAGETPAGAGGRTVGPAPSLIVCSRLDDGDETRLLLGLGADGRSVTRFELVTPDFLWQVPGQPETRRFAAGESDASPDLAGARFAAISDADGALRVLDFAAPTPTRCSSRACAARWRCTSWQNDRALGSLFHAATGNLVDVTAVQCARFAQPATGRW